MKKMYLDRSLTLPLDVAQVVAWGVRRRHCVAVIAIADADTYAGGYDPTVHQLVAQLVAGGEWVRVWRERGLTRGVELVDGDGVSRATRYRRAKAARAGGSVEAGEEQGSGHRLASRLRLGKG